MVLTGGLGARAEFTEALASVLPQPLTVLMEKDLTLLGAAWLAGGLRKPPPVLAERAVAQAGEIDEARYRQWQAWMAEVVLRSV